MVQGGVERSREGWGRRERVGVRREGKERGGAEGLRREYEEIAYGINRRETP